MAPLRHARPSSSLESPGRGRRKPPSSASTSSPRLPVRRRVNQPSFVEQAAATSWLARCSSGSRSRTMLLPFGSLCPPFRRWNPEPKKRRAPVQQLLVLSAARNDTAFCLSYRDERRSSCCKHVLWTVRRIAIQSGPHRRINRRFSPLEFVHGSQTRRAEASNSSDAVPRGAVTRGAVRSWPNRRGPFESIITLRETPKPRISIRSIVFPRPVRATSLLHAGCSCSSWMRCGAG